MGPCLECALNGGAVSARGEEGLRQRTMRFMFVGGKRHRWAFLTLALALAVAACVATVIGFTLAGGRAAHASGPGGGGPCPQQWDGTPSCQFKGFTAAAQTFFEDTSACPDGVETQVQVLIAQDLSHGVPGSATETEYASLAVYQYDSCTYSYTDYYGSVTTADLQVQGRIDGATVHATIPTTVNFTDQAGPTFMLDMTWKGIGTVAKLTTSRDYRNGDIMTRTRMSGDDRMALVNGTVSDGASVYTISGMSDISYVQTGSLAIMQV